MSSELAAAGRIGYGFFMTPDSTPPPLQPAGAPVPSPAPKKRRWLLWGCGGLIALVLIVIATIAITLWWMQRPIKPVVLSAAEKAKVDEKFQKVSVAAESRTDLAPSRDSKTKTPAPDRTYVAGSKELKLTERELNGLLNANTDLGKTVRLELGRDAINAYLAVPIPQDFPVGGGKMFRARGRFRVSISNGEAPYAILEDVTILGLSLPKDWLGGIKGENLLADAVGEHNGMPVLNGVKSLRVVPGAIVLEVGE
ncbi:MAG: hypothetical protein ABIR24_12620 [Verrucomicrobiota bacterium]